MTEKQIVAKFEKARKAYEQRSREVNDLFMRLTREAIAAKVGEREAWDLINRCPSESITRVFMIDQFRDARIIPGRTW